LEVTAVDAKQFEKLLAQAGNLSPDQFKRLVEAYANSGGLDAGRIWSSAVYSVSEQKLTALGINRACPGCGSVAVVHNGTNAAGIKRFRCQDCGKSFTRFSGTLLEKSRFPWEVWVEVLRMVLNDDSLENIRTVLIQDFGCDGINLKTVFAMRMKLIHAMAAMPLPKLTGVIQLDESFVRESQKGYNRELVSYVKGIERVARYGRKPSKLGTMGAEFATILTAVDSRGYCICKVVSLGRTNPDSVIDLYETYCIDAAYLCSDANYIYEDACNLLDIPHYVRPSNYSTVIEKAGYLYPESGKPPEERKAHNRALLERLYREGQIDYISHREDLTYTAFDSIKKSYRLSLARVNELHSDIKLMIEKKMTNVATKYLDTYMGFFTYRRNWRVEHGHSPTNRRDAETILEQLIAQKITLTRPELEQITLDIPRPSGRSAQILKEKTETARKLTANKYFKYDEEDVPSFNTREILLDAPRSRLTEIAKAHKVKGHTKMTQWGLAAIIAKLPNIHVIVMDLIVSHRHYEIAEEDIKYLQSLRFQSRD
jgi:transposase-like protein